MGGIVVENAQEGKISKIVMILQGMHNRIIKYAIFEFKSPFLFL